MANLPFLTVLLLLLLALTSSLRPSAFAAPPPGLRLRLTHVDAGGPFTLPERIRRSALRSRHRRRQLHASPGVGGGPAFRAPVTSARFEYMVEFAIGTPRLPAVAVLDTGSELVWTQCRPCERCVKQGTPMYDPSKSSSFSQLPCTSPVYEYQVLKRFNPPRCGYVYAYGSAAGTKGALAEETFTFGGGAGRGAASAARLIFGCSRSSKGNFAGTSGIVGLGQGKLSLVSQLKVGRFSYCLTPFNSSQSSPLLLGSLADLKNSSSRKVQSTPFLNDTNLYYVSMRGISIGETSLRISSSIFGYKPEENRGAVIDSGTGQTQLPQQAYDAVKSEIKSLVGGLPVRDLRASVGLDLCFAVAAWPPPQLPHMTFHFEGADMRVPPENYMYADQSAGAFCLVMQPGGSNLTVIGNFQQQNMHVVYDVAARVLFFAPADCNNF